MSIPSNPNQIDGLRNAIIEFVVAYGDDLSNNSAVTQFLAQREQHTGQQEASQRRHQALVEAKQEYQPLDRKVSESRQALTKAESDLATLHESLGQAAFSAMLSGVIAEQACFFERQALKRRIDDLQAQHDGLATATDAGVRQKLTAKAKQVVVIGKMKLEERKVRAADTGVGLAIITSDLDDSVRCATTDNLLDRVAHCRDCISGCVDHLRQSEMARDNCRQDLCKTLSLAHIEGLETLDGEIEVCRRTSDEADVAMRQAGLSLIDSLSVADQATLPTALADQLAQLKTLFQRELVTVSHPGEPATPDEMLFVTGTFPRPSLVLICWKCRTETLIAERCENCGGLDWHSSNAADGGGGYFCTRCDRGYTVVDCPTCAQQNSHVNFHFHKTLAEEKEDAVVGCMWGVVIVLIVLGFVVALILDMS